MAHGDPRCGGGPAAKARRPSREAGPPLSPRASRRPSAQAHSGKGSAAGGERPVTSRLLLPERPQRQSAPGGGGERGTFWKRPLEGASALPYPRSGRRRGRGRPALLFPLPPAEKAAPQVPSSRGELQAAIKGNGLLILQWKTLPQGIT